MSQSTMCGSMSACGLDALLAGVCYDDQVTAERRARLRRTLCGILVVFHHENSQHDFMMDQRRGTWVSPTPGSGRRRCRNWLGAVRRQGLPVSQAAAALAAALGPQQRLDLAAAPAG